MTEISFGSPAGAERSFSSDELPNLLRNGSLHIHAEIEFMHSPNEETLRSISFMPADVDPCAMVVEATQDFAKLFRKWKRHGFFADFGRQEIGFCSSDDSRSAITRFCGHVEAAHGKIPKRNCNTGWY